MKKLRDRRVWGQVIALSVLFSAMGLFASENGGSVYPGGAEGFLIAAAEPGTGQTQVQNYNSLYTTTAIDDAHGKSISPSDFKLISVANAVKLSHNWGVRFLGGELGSYVAIPNVYQRLSANGQQYTKDAIGNFNIAPFAVYMHKGSVFQTYELGFEPAGSGYDSAAKLNIGQHNIAITPAYAITVMPEHGKADIGARIDYVINDQDHVTHYHSGNELYLTFDAQQHINVMRSNLMTIGIAGYYFQQITDDKQNGKIVVATNADGSQSFGYKGQRLSLGPQVTFPVGSRGALLVKWNHDVSAKNGPRGNAVWFELGIPFSYLHHPKTESVN